MKILIFRLRKHISNSDYILISDLVKIRDENKKLLSFDISSKKKIILVSLKKNIGASGIENLGASFYDKFKTNKINNFVLVSDTFSIKQKNLIGYFLHGLKLKSYIFEKYKTKKNKKNISVIITGKNQPSLKEQIKFRAIERGTFYERSSLRAWKYSSS